MFICNMLVSMTAFPPSSKKQNICSEFDKHEQKRTTAYEKKKKSYVINGIKKLNQKLATVSNRLVLLKDNSDLLQRGSHFKAALISILDLTMAENQYLQCL